MVKEQWILGIYDVTQKRGFISYIPNRSAQVLEALITEHVVRGTEIWTDQWRGYSNLQQLGYTHKTVNHSRFFRDPTTGVCTNHVEGYWSKLKQWLRRLGVMASPFLGEYIDQFLWNSVFGSSSPERILQLTQQISQKY